MGLIKRYKVTETLEEHASFIIPLMITYVFGIIFMFLTYYDDTLEIPQSQSKDILKLVLNSLVPTTITYVLGESIHNFISLYKKKTGHYIWTVFTLISVGIYEMLFLIYTVAETVPWICTMLISTLVVLFLNALSYRDCYFAVNRNHGLV